MTFARKTRLVSANVFVQGRAHQFRAHIQRTMDETTHKNVHLRQPVTISVTKSPVVINYPLYQVGVSNLIVLTPTSIVPRWIFMNYM